MPHVEDISVTKWSECTNWCECMCVYVQTQIDHYIELIRSRVEEKLHKWVHIRTENHTHWECVPPLSAVTHFVFNNKSVIALTDKPSFIPGRKWGSCASHQLQVLWQFFFQQLQEQKWAHSALHDKLCRNPGFYFEGFWWFVKVWHGVTGCDMMALSDIVNRQSVFSGCRTGYLELWKEPNPSDHWTTDACLHTLWPLTLLWLVCLSANHLLTLIRNCGNKKTLWETEQLSGSFQ